LRLINGDWQDGALSHVNQLTLRLQPAGASFQDYWSVEHTPAGRVLTIGPLDDHFPEALAAAQSIRVERNGEPVFEIAFGRAAAAIEEVRQCEHAVMREWGIDPVAHAALRTLPRGEIGRFVTNSDYPDSALPDGHEGTVTVRLTIDPEGKVTDCAPVVSSGHEDLDRRTCTILVRRARLTPAIGADGAPASADIVASISWNIYP